MHLHIQADFTIDMDIRIVQPDNPIARLHTCRLGRIVLGHCRHYGSVISDASNNNQS